MRILKKFLILPSLMLSTIPLWVSSCSQNSLKLIGIQSEGNKFTFIANHKCYWKLLFLTTQEKEINISQTQSFTYFFFFADFDNGIDLFFKTSSIPSTNIDYLCWQNVMK